MVDAADRIAVPPNEPSYLLRRVWLSERIEKEYYYGLANQGLWPLCHAAFQRPRFSRETGAVTRRPIKFLPMRSCKRPAAARPWFLFRTITWPCCRGFSNGEIHG